MAEIITLAGRFKNSGELQRYADAQYLALKSASDRITKLEDEIKHLKGLLAATVPVVGEHKTDLFVVSKEQAILEAQIRLLNDRGLEKELTLEETKRLDLLIKNLNLVKSQNFTIPADSKKVDKRSVSDAVLVQIASQKNENE